METHTSNRAEMKKGTGWLWRWPSVAFYCLNISGMVLIAALHNRYLDTLVRSSEPGANLTGNDAIDFIVSAVEYWQKVEFPLVFLVLLLNVALWRFALSRSVRGRSRVTVIAASAIIWVICLLLKSETPTVLVFYLAPLLGMVYGR